MANWIDVTTPVTGTSVYVDGQLVGKHMSVTLPGFVRKVASYDAIGTEIPLDGSYDTSNLQIHHIGVDSHLAHLAIAGVHEYQIRFTQTKLEIGGETRTVGGVCFVKGRSKGIPETALELGTATDTTIEIVPDTAKLVVDGETLYDVDKWAGIAKFWGVDERTDIENYL